PDRRVERAREIDPRQLAAGVVGGPSGYQQVADGKVRAGAVVERAGGVFRGSHRATLAQGHWAMKQTASILLPSGSRTKAAQELPSDSGRKPGGPAAVPPLASATRWNSSTCARLSAMKPTWAPLPTLAGLPSTGCSRLKPIVAAL